MKRLAALVAALSFTGLTPAVAHAPEKVFEAKVRQNTPAMSREYAANRIEDFGWSKTQFDCLNTLWTRESNWRHTAVNKNSGAYGIPQGLTTALRRMTPQQQVDWGINYIKTRYDTPCRALRFWDRNHWY